MCTLHSEYKGARDMKKFLSVLLSLMIILSSLGLVASAQSGLSKSFVGQDVDALVTSGALDDVELVPGFTVGDLYSGNTSNIFYSVKGITRDDATLAESNLNSYILTKLRNKYGLPGDTTLYTRANAERLVKFFGHLFNPNFKDEVTGSDGAFSNCETESGFFKVIANLSGMSELLQNNWCNFVDTPQEINFTALLNMLNFDFEDDLMLGHDKFKNGERVATVMVKGIIYGILRNGPVDYFLNFLSMYARAYYLNLSESVEALFNLQINAGKVKREELYSVKSILKLIADAAGIGNEFEFIATPDKAFASATKTYGSEIGKTDKGEMFLYSMAYLKLAGYHKNNSKFISKLASSQTVKYYGDPVVNFINLLNPEVNSEVTLASIIESLLDFNKSNIGTNALRNWLNILASFFKNFADMFQKMMDSLRNFGKF